MYTEVWGYSTVVASRALDTMVRRLRQKIEADPTDPQHLLTDHGEGYRFEPLRGPAGAAVNGFLVAVGRVRAHSDGLPSVPRLLADSGGTPIHREGDEHVVSFASAARAVAFCLAAVDGGGTDTRGAGCAVPAEGDGEGRVRRLLSATGAGRVVLTGDLYAEVVAATGIRERAWRPLGGVRLSIDGPPERLYETGGSGEDGLRSADGNLVPPLLPTVGRRVERARILDLLRHDRLVTITGTGGVGKTRMALDVGEAWRSNGGGAWFADLSGCRTSRDVTVALARTLGIPVGPDTDPAHALAALPHDLVVLDNAEQAVAAVREQVARWCEGGSGARLLVTSRERLGLAGERPIELAPLSESDGVQLFQERAAGIGVDVSDSPSVRGLVERVEGLPLAIELAAARSEILAPEQLLARLERSLDAIGRDPARTARHADLQATVRWSWDLLDPEEQRVLVASTVFAAPFSADDIEAVAGGDGVLDALHGLRRKGLLRGSTASPPRFAPWVPVRTFAAGAADPAVRDALRDRHARWYARWGGALAGTAGRSEAAFRRLVDDLPDLLAAFEHTIGRAPELAVDVFLGAARVWASLGPPEALEAAAARVLTVSSDVRIHHWRIVSGPTPQVLREVDVALDAETDPTSLLVRSMIARLGGDPARAWLRWRRDSSDRSGSSCRMQARAPTGSTSRGCWPGRRPTTRVPTRQDRRAGSWTRCGRRPSLRIGRWRTLRWP